MKILEFRIETELNSMENRILEIEHFLNKTYHWKNDKTVFSFENA